MRIAFFDPIEWDYRAATPYERALGGSQSALCYLSVELARLGHAVTVINNISAPGQYSGVRFVNFTQGFSASFMNEFEVVVFINLPIGSLVKQDLGLRVPCVYWNHHAINVPSVKVFERPEIRDAWDAIVFVSQWQLETTIQKFGVAREKTRLIRNAVSPAFLDIDPGTPWFVRGEAPVLFYASMPFYGLDVLLRAFPAIRGGVPGARLRIFSSMAPYQVRSANDQFANLYDQSRTMDGVEYVGSLSQRALAAELCGMAALAYPTTVAETSCIVALEAMAAGALVLTTRRGALPETTGGFARMIDWDPDRKRFAESFAAMVTDTFDKIAQRPDAVAARRDEQIAFIRNNYSWQHRAREWSDWLPEVAGRR